MTLPPDPPPATEPEPGHWPVPEVDALDLAASGALDDWPAEPDATSAGAARPSADGVAARMAQLRPAIDAVADPIHQPDTTVRDEQVRRALARGRVGVSAPTALGAARGRSTAGGVGRARRWLAVAAAVVVVALGGLVVAQLVTGGSHDERTASLAGPAAATTRPAAASPEASGTAGGLRQLQDLGSADDARGLLALVQHRPEQGGQAQASAPTTAAPQIGAPAAATAGALGSGHGATCVDAVRAARPGLGPLDLVARATLAGQPVEVLVFRTGPAPGDGTRLVAVRPSDCRVIVDQPA